MESKIVLTLIVLNACYRGIESHEYGFDGGIIEEFISSFPGGGWIFLDGDCLLSGVGIENKGNPKIEIETVFEDIGNLLGTAVVF